MTDNQESLSYEEKRDILLSVKRKYLSDLYNIKGIIGVGLNITKFQLYVTVKEITAETIQQIPLELDGIPIVCEGTENLPTKGYNRQFAEDDRYWVYGNPYLRDSTHPILARWGDHMAAIRTDPYNVYMAFEYPYHAKLQSSRGVTVEEAAGTMGSLWWSNKYKKIAYVTNGHVNGYDCYAQREMSPNTPIVVNGEFVGNRPNFEIESLKGVYTDLSKYVITRPTNSNDPRWLPPKWDRYTFDNTNVRDMSLWGVKRYRKVGLPITSITSWDGLVWNSLITSGSYIKIEGDNFGMNYSNNSRVYLNDTIECQIELWTQQCIIVKLPANLSGQNHLKLEAEGNIIWKSAWFGDYLKSLVGEPNLVVELPLMSQENNPEMPDVIRLGTTWKNYGGYTDGGRISLQRREPFGEIVDTLPMQTYYPDDPEYQIYGDNYSIIDHVDHDFGNIHKSLSDCDSSYGLIWDEAEKNIDDDSIEINRGVTLIYGRNRFKHPHHGQRYTITGVLSEDKIREYLPIVKTGAATGTTYAYITDAHFSMFLDYGWGKVDYLQYQDIVRYALPNSIVADHGDSGSTVVTTTPEKLFEFAQLEGIALSDATKNAILNAVKDTNGNLEIPDGLAVGSNFVVFTSVDNGACDRANVWAEKFDLTPLSQVMKICGGWVPTESSLISDIETIQHVKIVADSYPNSEIYFIKKPTIFTLELSTVGQAGSEMTFDLESTGIIQSSDFEGDLSTDIIPSSSAQFDFSLVGSTISECIVNSNISLSISINEIVGVESEIQSDIQFVENTPGTVRLKEFFLELFNPPPRDRVNFTLIPNDLVVYDFEGQLLSECFPQSSLTISLDLDSFIETRITIDGLVEYLQNKPMLYEYYANSQSEMLLQSMVIKAFSLNALISELVTPLSQWQFFTESSFGKQYEDIYFTITRTQEVNLEITRSIDINLAI